MKFLSDLPWKNTKAIKISQKLLKKALQIFIVFISKGYVWFLESLKEGTQRKKIGGKKMKTL